MEDDFAPLVVNRFEQLTQHDRAVDKGLLEFVLHGQKSTFHHRGRAQERLAARISVLKRKDKQIHTAIVQYDATGDHVPENKKDMKKSDNINLYFDPDPFTQRFIPGPVRKKPSMRGKEFWCPCGKCRRPSHRNQ